MLKTRVGDEIWLVTQPDHAAVSGFLATRWGNDVFSRPGDYGSVSDHARLRAEVIFAIAEHDNGWWEWEADPKIDEDDGLPLHLTDVARQSSDEAMERWRLGVPRFALDHPYAALLISWHAHWLYAPRCDPHGDPSLFHPIVRSAPASFLDWDPAVEEARDFVRDLDSVRRPLETEVTSDSERAAWLAPEVLHPHVRLLQILDSLSLVLCSEVVPAENGQARGPASYPVRFEAVPRESRSDRVTLDLAPAGERRLVCRPFPFDRDPLRVDVLVRRLPASEARAERFHTWWHAVRKEPVEFEIASS